LLRRVHAAAVADDLRAGNPAISIRAPRDRRALEDFGYLSEFELALLFRAVPRDDELKHVRDRALLGSLGLQALRTGRRRAFRSSPARGNCGPAMPGQSRSANPTSRRR
jgi:hypothetical protein